MSSISPIQALPIDVAQLIFTKLDTESRVSLAITCKRMDKAYVESVHYERVPDHRPYLQTVREQTRTYAQLETFRKMSCIQKSLCGAGIGCTVTSYILISSACGCCSCCTVSAAAATGLKYAALSSCGVAIVNFVVAAFSSCCNNREKNEHLAKEYNEEDALLQQHRSKLQIQEPPSREVYMEDYSTSYQGGDALTQ